MRGGGPGEAAGLLTGTGLTLVLCFVLIGAVPPDQVDLGLLVLAARATSSAAACS